MFWTAGVLLPAGGPGDQGRSAALSEPTEQTQELVREGGNRRGVSHKYAEPTGADHGA